MFSVPAIPLATLLLLVASSPALAGMDCMATTVYVDQTSDSAQNAHSVCVSPGLTTTISFSEKLQPGSVRLKEAKRFVEKGQYVVTEAEAPREWPRAACRLTLWDESHKRTVAVDNLRFFDLLSEAAADPGEQQP